MPMGYFIVFSAYLSFSPLQSYSKSSAEQNIKRIFNIFYAEMQRFSQSLWLKYANDLISVNKF